MEGGITSSGGLSKSARLYKTYCIGMIVLPNIDKVISKQRVFSKEQVDEIWLRIGVLPN